MQGLKLPQRLPVSGGGKTKVELDKRSLFALASDTRLDILKALQANRRTVSQLADLLSIDKAAVHRHLKKLEEGGFVVRTEDHGFVYYGLSWKARDILTPNDNTKIVLLLTCSLVCVIGMVAVVYLASVGGGGMEMAYSDSGQEVRAPEDDAPLSILYPQNPWSFLVPTIILGLAAFALLYSAYLYWRRPRQRGGEDTPGPARAVGTED